MVSKIKSLRPGVAAVVVLGAVFAVMAAWTWRTWPDVLVDFGREVYTAWRISQGQTLYVDVAWFNGPLSAYFNGLLFWVFGTGIMTLAGANMLILAGVTAVLYWLLDRAWGWVGAIVGCLLLLTVFGFGQLVAVGNYNFISPYSHELTHGLALALAAMAMAWRAIEKPSLAWGGLAGIAAGLCFLTKPEPVAALVVGLFAMLLSAGLTRREGWATAGTVTALMAATAGLVIVAAWSLLARAMTSGDAWHAVLGAWTSVLNPDLQQLPFYRQGMGTLDTAKSLRALGAIGSWWTLGFAGAAMAAWSITCGKRLNLLLGCLAFWYVLAGLLFVRDDVEWLTVMRPLPMALLAAALVIAVARGLRGENVRDVEAETDDDATALRISLCVFSLAMLGKMILNARVYHYGFALAMPGTAVLAAMLTSGLPRWFEARSQAGAVMRGAAIALVVVFIGMHLTQTHAYLKRKNVALGEGRDLIYADARGEVIKPLLDELTKHVTVDQTVAVMPEGVMLNYLARRINPTPYISFMPPEVILFGEDDMIMALHETPPDYLLITHKPTAEYGLPYFGRDYAQKLGLWINESYERVARYGDPPLMPGTTFGIDVYRLKRPPGSFQVQDAPAR
ncbi:MAG: glycosyltransferase family 39 protein [Phycisphaeraceae bacterium]|nr:glycosyltransferase family 39 protein [Phycisphaeraceae bacterium]